MINKLHIIVQQNIIFGFLILLLKSCSSTPDRPPEIGTKRVTPAIHSSSTKPNKTPKISLLPPRTQNKRSEAYIEAEQIMEFHCMKYGDRYLDSKNGTSSEKKCQQLMISHYRTCLKENSRNDQAVLTCIKSKLRLQK